MGILNAYYFPDGGTSLSTSEFSPVNSFRVVLSKYFGHGLELAARQKLLFRLGPSRIAFMRSREVHSPRCDIDEQFFTLDIDYRSFSGRDIPVQSFAVHRDIGLGSSSTPNEFRSRSSNDGIIVSAR